MCGRREKGSRQEYHPAAQIKSQPRFSCPTRTLSGGAGEDKAVPPPLTHPASHSQHQCARVSVVVRVKEREPGWWRTCVCVRVTLDLTAWFSVHTCGLLMVCFRRASVVAHVREKLNAVRSQFQRCTQCPSPVRIGHPLPLCLAVSLVMSPRALILLRGEWGQQPSWVFIQSGDLDMILQFLV